MTEEAVKSPNDVKTALANATLPVHPWPDAPLTLMTDASSTVIGTSFRQTVSSVLQPLAFFSKKPSSAEIGYSVFRRGLLVVYLAIRRFLHFLEGGEFVVFTDHKPLVLLKGLPLVDVRPADPGCTAVNLVYGTSLRLSGELVPPANTLTSFGPCSYVDRLRGAISNLRGTTSRASPVRSFIPPDTCDFVLVRRAAFRRQLQPPYDRPYKVLRRSDKDFVIDRNGKTDAVSIDRVKPAHVEGSE
ncbi:hypothetical protein SprV_0200938800 [Sparganum proliferum]